MLFYIVKVRFTPERRPSCSVVSGPRRSASFAYGFSGGWHKGGDGSLYSDCSPFFSSPLWGTSSVGGRDYGWHSQKRHSESHASGIPSWYPQSTPSSAIGYFPPPLNRRETEPALLLPPPAVMSTGYMSPPASRHASGVSVQAGAQAAETTSYFESPTPHLPTPPSTSLLLPPSPPSISSPSTTSSDSPLTDALLTPAQSTPEAMVVVAPEILSA
jgi:hypothetical protein